MTEITQAPKNKIALVRIDRIGDLISTMPVDQILPPTSEVHWIIHQGLSFIPKNAVPPRKYFEVHPKNKWECFLKVKKYFQENQFDQVVLFHTPWYVSLAALLAGIPKRTGVLSQWHSFLFLNHRLRQKRSASTQHEADYNFDLLKFAINSESTEKTPVLKLDSKVTDEALFKKFNLIPQDYYVVHPGMSGSALNWPTNNYQELIYKITIHNKVVITGTQADQKYLSQLEHLKNDPQVIWAQNQLSAEELITVLKNSKGVVAPSTGVVHIAASTGVKTVGIYSPIPVQSPIRWAPRGDNAQAIQPVVACPVHFKCLGKKCKHYNCLKKITVDEVYKALCLNN